MTRGTLRRYLQRLAVATIPIFGPGCKHDPAPPADAAAPVDFAAADLTTLPDLYDPCSMVPLSGGCVWFAFVDAGIPGDARFVWLWSPDGGADGGDAPADMAGIPPWAAGSSDPCAPCRFALRDDLWCGQCGLQWTGCGPTYFCSAEDCSNQCLGVGRRPAGLVVPPLPGASGLGGWLAQAAHLEAAAVPAFAHLERELAAHRAPERLIAGARRARIDEQRHAQIMGDLARARGARIARLEVEPRPVRPLDEVALDNAVEGCVRERLGAVTLARQARQTPDPALSSLLTGIAADEARHARLSYAIDAWSARLLPPAARARVAAARKRELAALGRA